MFIGLNFYNCYLQLIYDIYFVFFIVIFSNEESTFDSLLELIFYI
jgi:hypothetical protein